MGKNQKTIIIAVGLVVLIAGAYFGFNALSGSWENQGSSKRLKAPDFRVTDSAGEEYTLSDFIGQPIVVNFWASWCGPCQSEMPAFDKAYNEVKDDVVFMMLNMVDGQRETKESGEKYIKENNFTFPVYFDIDQFAAGTYDVSVLPTTVFIDREGYIVRGYKGGIDEETLKEALKLIQ